MGNLEGKFVTQTCFPESNTNCTCPRGFSGETDYISFDPYGCPNSLIAEKLSWSLVWVGSVVITIKHVAALKRQWPLYVTLREKAKRKGKGFKWYKHPPLQIILIGFLTMCPATFVLGAIKVLEFEERQIGYHVVPSLCSIGIGVAGFATNALAETRNFSMLLKNTKMNKEKARSLKKYLASRYTVSVFMYALATCFAAFFGFNFRDVNPYESPMRFVSICRNLSAAALLLVLLKINRQVSLETKSMLEAISSENKSQVTNKAQKVLDFLEASAAQKSKTSKLAILLYSIASTPPFWPFQGYFFCLTTTQVILTRNHPINVYIQNNSKRVDPVETGADTSAHAVTSSVPNTSAAPSESASQS